MCSTVCSTDKSAGSQQYHKVLTCNSHSRCWCLQRDQTLTGYAQRHHIRLAVRTAGGQAVAVTVTGHAPAWPWPAFFSSWVFGELQQRPNVFWLQVWRKPGTPEFHLATEFGENCHAILPNSPTELPKIRQIWRIRQLKKTAHKHMHKRGRSIESGEYHRAGPQHTSQSLHCLA